MSFAWLHRWLPKGRSAAWEKTRRIKRRPRVHLGVEVLEDRITPSLFSIVSDALGIGSDVLNVSNDLATIGTNGYGPGYSNLVGLAGDSLGLAGNISGLAGAPSAVAGGLGAGSDVLGAVGAGLGGDDGGVASHLVGLAGDVAGLAGAPPAVSDALGAAGAALAAATAPPTPHPPAPPYPNHGVSVAGDLLSLASHGAALVNDGIPTGNPGSQPLSVTVSLPNGPNPSQSGTIAAFSDPNSAAPANAYITFINWGDGSSLSRGQVVAAPSGGANYLVTGSHVYTNPGRYSVTVAVGGNGAQGLGSEMFVVNRTDPPAQGTTVAGQNPASDHVPASGSNSGNAASASGTGAQSSLGNGPNATYVDNLYNLLLHRPADAGASYWVSLLNQGAARSSVIQGIENSSEYLGNVVTGIYQHYLNRAPDPGGLSHWVGVLQSGTSIEQVIQQFIASPEFYQVEGGGTNAGFVTAFYRDILNRSPDPAGYAHWLNALDSGSAGNNSSATNAGIMALYRRILDPAGNAHSLNEPKSDSDVSRAGMAWALLTSQEYRNDLVDSYYQEALRRNADAGGLAAWSQALGSGLSDQAVLAAILGSAEGFADGSK